MEIGITVELAGTSMIYNDTGWPVAEYSHLLKGELQTPGMPLKCRLRISYRMAFRARRFNKYPPPQ